MKFCKWLLPPQLMGLQILQKMLAIFRKDILVELLFEVVELIFEDKFLFDRFLSHEGVNFVIDVFIGDFVGKVEQKGMPLSLIF